MSVSEFRACVCVRGVGGIIPEVFVCDSERARLYARLCVSASICMCQYVSCVCVCVCVYVGGYPGSVCVYQ